MVVTSMEGYPLVSTCKLHETLNGLPGVTVVRDDILVMGHGDNEEEAIQNHDENLVLLLEQAHNANLHLNSIKMNLRKSEVRFMDHLITKDGLKPDPKKVRALQEIPKPTFRKELLSLLELINYLSKFLSRLSEVAQPLREMTAKGSKVHLVPTTRDIIPGSARACCQTSCAQVL